MIVGLLFALVFYPLLVFHKISERSKWRIPVPHGIVPYNFC